MAKKTTATKKAPKQPGFVGVIHSLQPDGGCGNTCSFGFDSTALDLARPVPRKVIATVSRLKDGTWTNGTPFLNFKLAEIPAPKKAAAPAVKKAAVTAAKPAAKKAPAKKAPAAPAKKAVKKATKKKR